MSSCFSGHFQTRRNNYDVKRDRQYALELKVKWDNRTIEEGKKQLDEYLDTLGLKEGYLVIFDPGDNDWEEKIYYKETEYNGKKITMVGL